MDLSGRPDRVDQPGRPSSAAGELVEWVDAGGEVLGVVTRGRMRAERLRHRAVFVAVVDGADRVVVHRRAEWKDVWPGRWDLGFGGVAGVGERWEDAARRELAEEAGIDLPGDDGAVLEVLGEAFTYDDADVSLLGRAFAVRTDRPVRPDDGEVVAVDRIARHRLAAWAAERLVCPDSLAHLVPALLGASPRRPHG